MKKLIFLFETTKLQAHQENSDMRVLKETFEAERCRRHCLDKSDLLKPFHQYSSEREQAMLQITLVIWAQMCPLKSMTKVCCGWLADSIQLERLNSNSTVVLVIECCLNSLILQACSSVVAWQCGS